MKIVARRNNKTFFVRCKAFAGYVYRFSYTFNCYKKCSRVVGYYSFGAVEANVFLYKYTRRCQKWCLKNSAVIISKARPLVVYHNLSYLLFSHIIGTTIVLLVSTLKLIAKYSYKYITALIYLALVGSFIFFKLCVCPAGIICDDFITQLLVNNGKFISLAAPLR